MRTIAIKMRGYAESVKDATYGMEGAIFKALIGSLGVLAIAYFYLLGNMVFNIIERKAYEAEAHKLSGEVANLELSYLAMSSEVDLNYSQSLGFKEIKPTFATRRAVGSLPLKNFAQ